MPARWACCPDIDTGVPGPRRRVGAEEGSGVAGSESLMPGAGAATGFHGGIA
jgi:hypothetical protein